MVIGGEDKPIPDLGGISGSPLFCIDHFVQGIWSPERCLKIIGMEKAVKKHDYIRATKSTCIELSIRKRLGDFDNSQS